MAANDRRLPADLHALYDWVGVRALDFFSPASSQDLVIDYADVTRIETFRLP